MPLALKIVMVVLFALAMWAWSYVVYEWFGPYWSAFVDGLPAMAVWALLALGAYGFVWAIRDERRARKAQRDDH